MITLENDVLTVKIKTSGAEVVSVVDKATGHEFMWQADAAYWGRHAPVLFPIVGRLKKDAYEYDGETYEMTQHGFARDSMFEVVEDSDHTAVFSLRANAETRTKYPFEFELQIKYVLEEERLTVAYEVKNLSADEEMFYGVGGHPAFNVSQTTNEAGEVEFNQVQFRFESNDEVLYIPLSENGYLQLSEAAPTKVGVVDLTHESFKNDAFIYKIQPNTQTILTDHAADVEIRVTSNEMEHIGIWSPYPARGGFVCLEPWAGVADDEETSGRYNEKYGIQSLDPATSKTHDYTLEFNKKA